MSNLEQDLARRLTSLRRARNWSLEQLAARTGISRATLSRIERCDSSPTASILGKLATAFGLSIAEVFGSVSNVAERHIVRDRQPVWHDPETGFRRRSLSPLAGGYRGTMIEGVLPAGQTISYDMPPVPDLEHHLLLLEGALRCSLGKDVYDLEPGDCLRFQLNFPNSYRASGDDPARYLLTVISP